MRSWLYLNLSNIDSNSSNNNESKDDVNDGTNEEADVSLMT